MDKEQDKRRFFRDSRSPTTIDFLRYRRNSHERHRANTLGSLNEFVKHTDRAVVMLGHSGAVVWNPIAEQMSGITHEEVQKLGLEEVIKIVFRSHPDMAESQTQIVRDALETGKSSLFDNPVIAEMSRPDGIHYVEQKAFPVVIKGEKYIGFTAQDITEKVLAQKKLQESEEKFRQAFNSNPNSININRLEDGLYVSTNLGFQRILGYSPEDFVGKTSLGLNIWVNPDDRLKIIEAIKKDGFVTDFEAKFRTKDGHIRDGLMSAAVININGAPHIISITQDITDYKQAMAALFKSEREYHQLVEKLPEITYKINSDGKFEFISPQVESLFGYSADELSNVTFSDFVHPEDLDAALKVVRNAIFESKNNSEIEFRAIDKEGRYKWVFVRFNVDNTGNGPCITGVLSDITPRKESEARIMDLLVKLHEERKGVVRGWSEALDLRDEETKGHSERVTKMTLALANHFNISGDELDKYEDGALLHDIGKMGVPDAILRKAGPLSDDEWKIMRLHPVFAHNFLEKNHFDGPSIDIPHYHHEKWDGTGYPNHLSGEQIPLAARIFSVVDVWDALTSDRPYRRAWEKERVAAYLREESGKSFDPKVVEIFLDKVIHQ